MKKSLAVFMVVILTVLTVSVASLSTVFAAERNPMDAAKVGNSSANSPPVSSQSDETANDSNSQSKSQPSPKQSKTKRTAKAKLASSSGVYHATDEELKGTAYAVFNSNTGELDFIRSTESHSNGDTGTVKSISGGTYTGTIYTGFENNTTPYHFNSSYPNLYDFFPPWYSKHALAQSVNVVDAIRPNATAVWFEDFTSCTSMDLLKLDTSKVTDMAWMFVRCSKLTSLNVSNFDTSSVTTMNCMFWGCSSLPILDVSHFDTSQVTNMGGMFENCYKLTALDVSHFDTSKVTAMDSMFASCWFLTVLDVSHFDTSKVTDMYCMFNNCSSLTSLDVSHFDTSKVTNMGCMFNNCSSLTSLDVSHFDTSKVTNMGGMFWKCSKLTSLDLSNFDTSNVTSLCYMFDGCSSLTSLDVSNFDTSKVTSMNCTFYGCSNLASLDVSHFDTSNAVDMWGMFSNCRSVKTLDVSSFDTSKCQKLGCLFEGCDSLESVDVSKFNTASCTTFDRMFLGCGKLKKLDVSNFDTSSASDINAPSEYAFSEMFEYCSSLTSLDCSTFTNPNNGSTGHMFNNDTSLNKILFKNFKTNGTSVFPAPTSTSSGRISDGTWGLGSETAKQTYSGDGLSELGKTSGALSGTWYAQAKKYAVTLDANNGTGTMDAISIVNGSNCTLPANTFKRTGYKFTGWNTKADGSGTTYADKATIKPTSDMTLYAQWQFVPCVIKIPKAVSYSEMPVGVVSTDDSYDISVNGGNMYDVAITSATNGLTDGTATLNAIVNSVDNPLSFTGDGTKKDRVQIKGISRYATKYKGSINYNVKVTAK